MNALSPIEIEKQLETPVESDDQQALRRALAWFGPRGERWLPGPEACDVENGRGCIWFALFHTCIAPRSRAEDFLYEATRQLHGGALPSTVNNRPGTTFADVQRIYARAIELAAT